MENKVSQEGKYFYSFIHHIIEQYCCQSLYVIVNGNREEKGCEVLSGEHHRAGAVRAAIQLLHTTNFVLRTRALSGRDLLSQFLLLPALLVPAIWQSFPKIPHIKGTRNPFMGTKIKSTTHYQRFCITGLCWIVPYLCRQSLKDHGTNRWQAALLRC